MKQKCKIEKGIKKFRYYLNKQKWFCRLGYKLEDWIHILREK